MQFTKISRFWKFNTHFHTFDLNWFARTSSGKARASMCGLARRCRCRFDPRSRSFSLYSTPIFSSPSSTYINLFALFVQLPFSSLSCAGSSWLPLPLVSFPSFSLLLTPNRLCQSERRSKARHEADSFEPAEWYERLTPGQSGWPGAAAVGSIPALALSLFLQRLCVFCCHRKKRKKERK